VLYGDVKIMQMCSGDSSCIFEISIEAIAKALMGQEISQEARAEIMNMFSLKETDMVSQTELIQKIKSSIATQCNVSVNNIITDTKFLLGTSTLYGNIIISQDGTAGATCPINISATANALAKNKVNAKQVNGSNLDFLLSTPKYLAMIIVVVLVLIVAVVLVGKKMRQPK
jgi:hypothetical protein